MANAFRTIWVGLRVLVDRAKKVKCADGLGYTHIADGQDEVLFNVQVCDWKIQQMAKQAARSKTLQCTDGALRVQVRHSRKVS